MFNIKNKIFLTILTRNFDFIYYITVSPRNVYNISAWHKIMMFQKQVNPAYEWHRHNLCESDTRSHKTHHLGQTAYTRGALLENAIHSVLL